MGFTLLYLCLLVLIPLAGHGAASRPRSSWPKFWQTVTESPVLASYKLSFGASLVAATINMVFGFIVAWVLVRYPFPGQKAARRDGRFALCLADGRVGHRLDRRSTRRTAGWPLAARRWESRCRTRSWAWWWC